MNTTQKFAWLDTNEYPFSAHYFEVNGQQLHYIDEGQGTETILYVHGTPSWSFDFRHAIKQLSARYRVIALDHIGFGLSDKPKEYDYSTPNHAKTLTKFIEHLGLKAITLVLHDFGGIIGMDYALAHPENIKRLVVFNSWLWDCSEEPEYKKFRRILKSPLLPLLYKYLNFSPRFILPQSFGNRALLTKKLHWQYRLPFANAGERNGALAFARSLRDDQAWFGQLWDKIAALREVPVLFIWGMKDNFILPKYLDKYQSAFVNKKIVKLSNSGHFPQEEEPLVTTELIAEFIKV